MTNRTAYRATDLPTIEVALHERVERARIEYEMAIAEAQKLLEAAQQSTDGVSAIRRARHLQQTATQEYSEALRALTEFVLGRKAG